MRLRGRGRWGIRPGWLLPALLLTLGMAAIEFHGSSENLPAEGPLWALFSVLLAGASLLTAIGVYPWVESVTRRGAQQGNRGRVLAIFVMMRTLVPVVAVVGLAAWLAR